MSELPINQVLCDGDSGTPLTRGERIKRDTTMRIQNIPIKLVRDNPYQTRKKYPRHEIKLLAKNISERGLIHPISVVKANKHYVIVAGHRRLRAFKFLHRETIPSITRRQSTGKDLALDLAIENVLRKDFAPVEKGQAIFQVLCSITSVSNDLLRAFSLINQVKLTEARGEVGLDFTSRLGFDASDANRAKRLLEMMGIGPNTAITYLRLLDLPGYIQQRIVVADSQIDSYKWLRRGYISVRTAYELSRIANNELRLQLFKRIIQEKIRYVHLKFIVNEMLEKGAEQFRNMNKGSALPRENNSMVDLSTRCFRLGSSLWDYRTKMSLDALCMDKVIFRASLKELRKSCLELVSRANVLLKGTTDDAIELVNQDFSLNLRKGTHSQSVAYTFPLEKVHILKVRPGDRLLMKILGVERKSRKQMPRAGVFEKPVEAFA